VTSTDEIRDAQDLVAALQARIDNALRVQRVAERRQAAKQRAQRLGVSIAVVAVGMVLVVLGGRIKRAA
jgi:hypothetical protein